MKALRIFWVLSLVGVGGLSSKADACSIHVNEVWMKNDLAAAAMSHLGFTVDSLIDSSVTQFGYTVVESNPSTLCPNRMSFTQRVQVKWKKNVVSTCTATVLVTKTEWWGEELPASGGPLNNYSFADEVAASCTPVFVRPSPIPRPVPFPHP